MTPHTFTRRRWLGHSAALLAANLMPLRGWGQGAQAAKATPSSLVLQLGQAPEPAAVRRIFAAGPPAAVLVACLAPEKLLGWPMRLSEAALGYLSPTLAALPHLGRLNSGGRGSTMPLEKLVALSPDLVLDAGTVDATYRSGMENIARQTGLPCVLLQGTLHEHARQLREAGALLGVPDRARQLADYADTVAALAAQVQGGASATPAPRVYFGRGAGGLETGLAGSINLEAIGYAGGQNVAAAAGRGGLTRVSMEQILAWDPQVVLTQDADFARQVWQDPVWRSVSAVRQGRVHCAPALPFGWLDGPPGINRLIGVRWLIDKLYPGHPALKDQPPLAEAAAQFYALFYGSQRSVADMQKLLRAGG